MFEALHSCGMLNMKGRWVDDCNWLRTEAISADNRSLSFSKNVCSSSGIFVTVVVVVVVVVREYEYESVH